MTTATQTVDVGRIDDLPVGKAKLIDIGGLEIGILRTAQGRVYAVRNFCPHRGGPVCLGRFGGTWLPADRDGLAWGLDDKVLQCPWHGWEFDLTTGKALFGVSDIKLQTYPVAVSNGSVVVTVKTRLKEPAT